MIMGDKPAYSLGPHSVRPLRRLAGGRAPSDPRVSGQPQERRAAGRSTPRSPVAAAAAESWPVVADDPAGHDPSTDPRPAGSLVVTGEGYEDPPVGGPLADWVAGIPGPATHARRARKTALTSILGVLGAVRRDSSPQDRL